jgi:hypothetical protein
MNSLLYSREGILERPVQATRWPVPERLEHDGKYLYWEQKWIRPAKLGHEFGRWASPARGMLERFVSLDETDTARILAFARRWGLLGVARIRGSVASLLNQAGLSDVIQCPEDLLEPKRSWYAPGNELGVIVVPHHNLDSETSTFYGWEPLYVWRYWIRQMSAALRVGSSLSVQESPNIKDWAMLLGLPDLAAFRPSKALLRHLEARRDSHQKPLDLKYEISWSESQWLCWRVGTPQHFNAEKASVYFQAVLRHWQRIGGVNLAIDPVENRLSIKTQCLFSGLVWQVLAASCSSDGIAVCSGCGKLYPPDRLPTAGTRHYCGRCREARLPQRDAVRAHRERRRIEESKYGKKARKQ